MRDGSIRGSQSIVRFFTTWERNFAVKRFENREDYEREVGILQLLRGSSNILQPLVAVDESMDVVFPFIKGGDLTKLNMANMYYDTLVKMVASMVKAIGAVHKADYLHMDIKPENFLHDGTQIYLIDFGLAIPLGEDRVKLGTPRTMAPEVMFPSAYKWPVSKASDWWSLGVTIFYLFSRFYKLDESMQHSNYPYEVLYADNKASRVRWASSPPKPFPPLLMDLLFGQYGLLSENYVARDYEHSELLKHPFFANFAKGGE